MSKSKMKQKATFIDPASPCPLRCGNSLDQKHLCKACSQRLAKICITNEAVEDQILIELMQTDALYLRKRVLQRFHKNRSQEENEGNTKL